jgi:hypothetical protein
MLLKKLGKAPSRHTINSGQALTEYALILALFAVLFGVALALTRPAIADVFSFAVYNLLGQRHPDEIEDLTLGRGHDAAFWATVQWISENPPVEAPIPPNPAIPPRPRPTEGPTPTPSPETPTLTPTLTSTQLPPPTPSDFAHRAPWTDPINNPEWYRVDNSIWLGGEDWRGEYFASSNNNHLAGTPVYTLWNRDFYSGPQGEYDFALDFTWPGGTGPIETWRHDNFSARWTRRIYIEGTDPVDVTFTLTSDDGARLWLDREPGCSSVPSGGQPTWQNQAYHNGCLVIDTWGDGMSVRDITRTLTPGYHTIQVDYYEAYGDGRIRLDIAKANTGINVDDRNLQGGSAPRCNWNHDGSQRVNSTSFMWEEQRNGEFPQNMRCHLELRGYVDIRDLEDAKFIFWDIWDLRGATSVQLQLAEYNEDPAERQWVTVPIHSPGSTNYNWTRHVVRIADHLPNIPSNLVTFRFVMQNTDGQGQFRRWYVDDISIQDYNDQQNYFTVCSNDPRTCGSYWVMDSIHEFNRDFIATGRWGLSSENSVSGMSLDSNPNGYYQTNYEMPGSPGNQFRRIHSVEFNGWVDLTGPMVPDFEGDEGAPMLSFYHAYSIGSNDRIELQWTRTPHGIGDDNWQTIEVFATGTIANTTMTFREVPLTVIDNWDTQPFRLRFALVVDHSHEERGWWIDNVYLERSGLARFTDYPFFDDAEGGTGNWLMEGRWNTTTAEGVFDSRHSFTDTPGGQYTHGSNASMNLRYYVDLNNDTPENINEYFDNNPAGGNSQSQPATRPILSFWHRRLLGSGDNFLVEWSKDSGQTWNTIWQYQNAQSTRIQRAWERIEIDLSPLQAGTLNNADPYDDDFLLRFRLDARVNGDVGDGIYIDNVSIEDYSETSHRLWDSSVNTGHGPGNGGRMVEDVDNPSAWWERWHSGGTWSAIDYNRRSGLRSFHDSPPANTRTPHQTYSVMEMQSVIDLRSTQAADNPTLYFWNRYDVGSNDRISVQIARENLSYVRNATSDYERRSGWDEWTIVWDRWGNARVDTWIREQISLDSYIGQRIKIRFVVNAYQNSDNRDGWYLDDISVEHRNPVPITLPFYDPAQNMQHWIGEGTWGLAPDKWRGAGSGPAPLGGNLWHGVFYDCERIIGYWCSAADFRTNLMYNPDGSFRAPVAGRDLTESVHEIYHDLGQGAPMPLLDPDPTWRDSFAARWTRDIVVDSGEYTFITVSDDGVRLRYEEPNGNHPPGWNIINNYTDHGRTVDYSTVALDAGNYRLILEWYEGGSDAVIILSAGRNNFSFTDSPKAGNSPSFPVVNAIEYGNSSLILRRPLSLHGVTRPVLEYYTRFNYGSGNGVVEISVDGGFTWTTANLNTNAGGFTCPPGAQCDPFVYGWHDPNDPYDWQHRQVNLSYYVNRYIGLRFRLQTWGGTQDGWYITDVQVNSS